MKIKFLIYKIMPLDGLKVFETTQNIPLLSLGELLATCKCLNLKIDPP